MKWCNCPKYDDKSHFLVPHVYRMPFDASLISRYPREPPEKQYKKATYLQMDKKAFETLVGEIWLPAASNSSGAEANSLADATVASTNDESSPRSLQFEVAHDSDRLDPEDTSVAEPLEG